MPADDEVIDLRDARVLLTAEELALLRSIVDCNMIDVAALGQSLGTSNEGVYDLLRSSAVKLAEFRYLAVNETPPLGHQPLDIEVRKRRRKVALQARR